MLQHLPVVCLPILAQRHRDTLVLEAQQEDLAGTAVPGVLSLGRICTFCSFCGGLRRSTKRDPGVEYGGIHSSREGSRLSWQYFCLAVSVWFGLSVCPMQAIVFKVYHVSLLSEFLGQVLLHLCSLIVSRATVPILNILLGLAISLWAWERAPATKPAAVRLVGWQAVLTRGPGGHLANGRDSESRGGAPGPLQC